MLNKSVVTKFALNAEFQSSYAQLDESRWYRVGYSTRIREVEEYGQPNQYELPTDTGHGFIWRLYNIARFEQRDGGVYVELEAVALSREVPGALRWVINPEVRRASKGSMLVSLQKTQEAVLAVERISEPCREERPDESKRNRYPQCHFRPMLIKDLRRLRRSDQAAARLMAMCHQGTRDIVALLFGRKCLVD